MFEISEQFNRLLIEFNRLNLLLKLLYLAKQLDFFAFSVID